MASCLKTLLLISILTCLVHQLTLVESREYEVGDDKGWNIPSKNSEKYNEWASTHRFQVDDSIRFKYKKADSVLVVTESEYDKCRSVHPIFFSNNGETVYQFQRSGLFYFISGVAGHCERGQKMIIKVLEAETPPAPPSNATDNQSSGGSLSYSMTSVSSYHLLVVLVFGFLLVQS